MTVEGGSLLSCCLSSRVATEPFDDLVLRGGDCRLARRTQDTPRWPATLFGPGDQDGLNAAGGVPVGAASDRGLDRLVPPVPGSGSDCARSLNPEPSHRNPGGVRTTSGLRRTCSPAGRQHRLAAVRAQRHPDAHMIVPPRSTTVLSETVESAPMQRDRHLQSIAEHGRMGWQKRSAYNRRALAETAVSHFKRVMGARFTLADRSPPQDRSRHRRSVSEPHA